MKTINKKNNPTGCRTQVDKKCLHKWLKAWIEMKGKTYSQTRYGYLCQKCHQENIKSF